MGVAREAEKRRRVPPMNQKRRRKANPAGGGGGGGGGGGIKAANLHTSGEVACCFMVMPGLGLLAVGGAGGLLGLPLVSSHSPTKSRSTSSSTPLSTLSLEDQTTTPPPRSPPFTTP